MDGRRNMYGTALTSVLTGASLGQLAHWRKHGPAGSLLEPEYGTRPRCLYSYDDVVALRMFVHLRQVRPLQQIRRAVRTLAEQRPHDHVAQHRLGASKREKRGIYWLDESGELVEMVENPGQGVIKVVMDDILGQFTAESGAVVPALHAPAEGLEVDRDLYLGVPTIAGTGVPYGNVASLVEDGMSGDEVRYWYPGVPDEAIDGAVSLHRRVLALRAA
jgi:uncharacterized protein (DUF433 family)